MNDRARTRRRTKHASHSKFPFPPANFTHARRQPLFASPLLETPDARPPLHPIYARLCPFFLLGVLFRSSASHTFLVSSLYYICTTVPAGTNKRRDQTPRRPSPPPPPPPRSPSLPSLPFPTPHSSLFPPSNSLPPPEPSRPGPQKREPSGGCGSRRLACEFISRRSSCNTCSMVNCRCQLARMGSFALSWGVCGVDRRKGRSGVGWGEWGFLVVPSHHPTPIHPPSSTHLRTTSPLSGSTQGMLMRETKRTRGGSSGYRSPQCTRTSYSRLSCTVWCGVVKGVSAGSIAHGW